MNALRKTLLVVVAVAVWATLCSSAAQAQAPAGPYCDGGYYGGLYYYLSNNPNIQPPPHFALHPPVYYSYPVPRTYGYSPFPYPASVMTPDPLGPPRPVTMINPYVPQKAKSQPASDQTTAAPQMITNPYASPTAVARVGG